MAIYARCEVEGCTTDLHEFPAQYILREVVAHVATTGHAVVVTGTAGSIVHDETVRITRLIK